MLTVSSLAPQELRARLARGGIRLQTGAFVTSVRSQVPQVADAIGLLYADYPLVPADGFADFHVSLVRPAGARRWFRPQVCFDNDGRAPFQPLPVDQAFPMFEWGLNWCVSSRAHSYLVIHAAVVEKNGAAAILPAPPGSGKSTLCAALVSRGWRLLSDELALVRPDTGELVPLPRPVSLKNGSIEVIRKFAPDAVFSRLVADTVKGTIAHMKPPADSVARAAEPARAAWIIFPKYTAAAAPQLVPVPQARSFLRLAENSFNYSLLGAAGFNAVAGLVDTTQTYDFTYSSLDDGIEVFSQLAAARA
jgi:HprK-related kinase A